MTTQRISSSEASRAVIMLGMAMLTIVRSSNVMKNPRDRVIRIAHGFPRHLLTAWGIRTPDKTRVTAMFVGPRTVASIGLVCELAAA